MVQQTVHGAEVQGQTRLGVIQQFEGPKLGAEGRKEYAFKLKSDNTQFVARESAEAFDWLKQTHRGDVVQFEIGGVQGGAVQVVGFVNKSVAKLIAPA